MGAFAGELVQWRHAIVPTVVQQHAEEAAILWQLRSAGARRANFSLMYLERFDQRLDAHLDGLAVAQANAWRFCEAALANPSAPVLFPASVRAIVDGDERRLDRLFALTSSVPESRPGLISAFGWCEPVALQGMVARLLSSDVPYKRMIGVAACGLHRVDAGLAARGFMRDADSALRARAFRAAGVLGNHELDSRCLAAIGDDDSDVRFWAAWSAVLLGNRGAALDVLAQTGASEGPNRARAFRLSLQAMPTAAADRMLKDLAADSRQLRWLIQGAGIVGDPAYVPWLIRQLENNETTRVAGEAFSLITGHDLALLDLERKPPADFEAGPNSDPADPKVDMDEDEGLPWPDPGRIQRWWDENGGQFMPGTRYFMGGPVTRQRCIEVLKNGYQWQRILAAHYLSLLNPGTPLFNTSAPAWRQQRLLAEMK
jgi:uncharacterized protein (TIGR02270 family)